MINIDQLTVGELKELTRLACVTKHKTKKEKRHGLQVCVLQRGWVYIGDVTQLGDEYTIQNGACIRRWGTTKGLGQIAKDGPTANTELEPCPTVRFHEVGKILMIAACEDKWAGKII